MAQLLLESFDHFADADFVSKWTQVVANGGTGTDASAIAAVGRRSTNGLRLKFTVTNASPNNYGFSKSYRIVLDSPAPSGATVCVGFAFRSTQTFTTLYPGTTSTGAPCLFAIFSGGTEQFWLRLNSNGTISAYRGTTLLGTSTSALTQNVTQYISVKVLLHGSAGTVSLKVDGVQTGWLTLTGLNTQNAGVSTFDELRLGPVAMQVDPPAHQEWNYDDLYVVDGSGSGWTDWKADAQIEVLRPDSNGTTRNWTPSTGTDDFAVTDETEANGDTDYLTGAAVNDKVTMGFPSVSVGGADIFGVQVVVQGRKTDAGASGHKAVTRIGGTDYLGTEVGLTSSYAFKRQGWDLKPSDSTPWTDTDVNAAEFGAQKSS